MIFLMRSRVVKDMKVLIQHFLPQHLWGSLSHILLSLSSPTPLHDKWVSYGKLYHIIWTWTYVHLFQYTCFGSISMERWVLITLGLFRFRTWCKNPGVEIWCHLLGRRSYLIHAILFGSGSLTYLNTSKEYDICTRFMLSMLPLPNTCTQCPLYAGTLLCKKCKWLIM